MLRQRIITALVLLAVLIPSLLASQVWPFASVVVVLLAAAAWEWGRLNGVAGAGPALIAAVVLLLCALQIWEILPRSVEFAIFVIASIVWVCGAAWALRGGVDGWRRTPRWARLTV
ncbi:MAG: hypothetical protein RLZ83_748, partial [Pseudomonadota bacterium]